MKQRFSLILILVFILFYSCSDGDIITLELEFDQELELCGNITYENYQHIDDSYVVYDIKEDPFESLILLFSGNATNDLIFFPDVSPYEEELTIGGLGSATRFNYRTYNGDPLELICEDIPSSTVNITNDYEASSGTIKTTSTFEDLDGTRTVTITFEVLDFNLEVLNSTNLLVGNYTHSYPTPE